MSLKKWKSFAFESLKFIYSIQYGAAAYAMDIRYYYYYLTPQCLCLVIA
jgi:hypothetical protein